MIEATIDHEKGYVQSKETSDVYMTREPMAAYHQRISFCLDIHNHSVKVTNGSYVLVKSLRGDTCVITHSFKTVKVAHKKYVTSSDT